MNEAHTLPRKTLYTESDLTDIPWLEARPGEFPYQRGIHSTMYAQRPWTIRQYAGHADATASNRAYRRALSEGAQGLSVAFDLPTHRGYDSDCAEVAADVGMAGVAIDSVEDMKRLFDGIELDKVSVSMTMSGAVLPVLASYIVAAEEAGVEAAQLRGTIQNDILKEFMARNTYIFAPDPSLRITTDVVQFVLENMPYFNAMSVSGYHLQEAGADGVLELALTLANAREYVSRLVAQGTDVERVCTQFSFFFAVGRDFFGEIAKLRAARVLWARLAQSLGACSSRALQLRMHCQTAGSSLSAQRVSNNVVRTTVEAMAAVFGGTQSLHTNAWDEALSLPGEAAAVLARDTQLILQNEMGLCNVVDPWGGSYLMESLTAQMVEGVETVLAGLDAQGGVLAALETGWIDAQIHQRAARIQAQTDVGSRVVVGLNHWCDQNPEHSDSVEVDGRFVRAQQVDNLRKLKSVRDERRVRAALTSLTNCARGEPGNLLALTVEAMRARATVGECTSALEHVWPRWRRPLRVEPCVYSDARYGDAAWADAKAAVSGWTATHGRKPRMMLLKLGQDGHDRGVRVVAAALGDAGFEVELGQLFATPDEAAAWIGAVGPDLVGVSSLAGAHVSLVASLIEVLREQGSEAPVVVGGIVPIAHHAALRKSGVAAIFGADTPIDQIVYELVNVLNEAKVLAE